jgi:hypothetical protein
VLTVGRAALCMWIGALRDATDDTPEADLFRPTFSVHPDRWLRKSGHMNRRAQLSRFTESNPNTDSQVYIVPAQPRTFGVEFGQDF